MASIRSKQNEKNKSCKWEGVQCTKGASLRSRKHQWSLWVGVVDLKRRDLQKSSILSSNVQGRCGTVQLCNHFTAWGLGTVLALPQVAQWRKHMKKWHFCMKLFKMPNCWMNCTWPLKLLFSYKRCNFVGFNKGSETTNAKTPESATRHFQRNRPERFTLFWILLSSWMQWHTSSEGQIAQRTSHKSHECCKSCSNRISLCWITRNRFGIQRVA